METGWKVFLTLFVLTLYALYVFIKYSLKTREDAWRKEQVRLGKKEIEVTSLPISAKVMVIGFVVIALLVWLWIPKLPNWKLPDWNWSALTTSQTSSAAAQTETSVQQRCTVSWYKTKGSGAGINPHKRSDSLSGTLHQNDPEVMAFTAEYMHNGMLQKASFRWNKKEKYGEWHQGQPNGSGLWRLEPVKGGKSFVGEVSDDKGIFVPLSLELD